MAAGATKEQINGYVRKVRKQYGMLEYRVIHASNGETAVLWFDAKKNDWVLNPSDAAASKILLDKELPISIG